MTKKAFSHSVKVREKEKRNFAQRRKRQSSYEPHLEKRRQLEPKN